MTEARFTFADSVYGSTFFWWSPSSVTRKNCQRSIKVAQKWFHEKNDIFCQLYKNSFGMWKIWANLLLPKALKSCPKSNKSPNLVTLSPSHFPAIRGAEWSAAVHRSRPWLNSFFGLRPETRSEKTSSADGRSLRRPNFAKLFLSLETVILQK